MRVAAALVSAIALAGAVTRPPLKSPTEWTQFRLDDANNAAVLGDLKTSWSVPTDAGFSSSPTVANGRLFIGNNGGEMYAIDPASGHVLWTYRAHNPFMSNPLVYRGLVIVGQGNQHAYPDPKRDPQKEPERLLVGTGESALLALDERTGAVRWRIATRGSAMPTGAIVGGRLVHHDGAGFLNVIDPHRGAVTARFNVRSVASMSALVPLANGDVLTTGAHPNAVLAVNPRTGRIAWRYVFAANTSGAGDCPPAADARYAFCNYLAPANGGQRTELEQPAVQHMYAVDTRTGRIAWDVATQSGPMPKYNEASIPLAKDGLVFSGNSCAPFMNAFDARTGKLAWRRPLLAVVKGGVSAKDGRIFFGDVDGRLWALNEQTGAVDGVRDIGAQFNVGSPLIAGNTIVIASNTGSIIAMPLSNIVGSRDL